MLYLSPRPIYKYIFKFYRSEQKNREARQQLQKPAFIGSFQIRKKKNIGNYIFY